MAEPMELTRQECERLLRGGVVGRAAVSTPTGPHIVPVNYSVVDDAIVFRTSPYSVLGTHGRNAQIAFEVDCLDYENYSGWSVVAHGRGDAVTDPDELAQIREQWPARPWADGHRHLHLRIRWTELTGRGLGNGWTPGNETSVRRSVPVV
jgi:hypothetical protein